MIVGHYNAQRIVKEFLNFYEIRSRRQARLIHDAMTKDDPKHRTSSQSVQTFNVAWRVVLCDVIKLSSVCVC